jgi:aspartate carbamoyltransferase regulatory subunit
MKTSDTNLATVLPETYSNLTDDPILPRTIRYICKNPKCDTHSNSSKKEAVFFRINNTYKIRYVCVECKTSWIV